MATSAHLPVHVLSVPIQPEVGELPPQAVVLQDVQHAGHLAEYEHPGALLLEPRQQLVQDAHLAAVDHQMSVCREWRACRGSYTLIQCLCEEK